MRIRRFLLGKWRGTVTTAPVALSIIYNGSNQTLILAGQGTGTMLYKLNNGSWSSSLPQAQNVNTYTVYYKAEENKKYKESEVGSITVAITKVTPTVTAPTAKTLTYNTQAQSLVNAGSTTWGTLKYSLDNKIFSTSIPTGTNADNYKVYYRVDGDGNINDIASAYIDVTISPKTVSSPTITLGTNSYVYDGQEKKPTVTSVKDGNVTIASTEYTVSYSNNTNAGTATCTILDKSGGNYTVSGTKTYTINKADTTYTAPTAKTLTYSGESQSLLNAGTVSGGTIKYSSDNTNWSDSIPSKTNAGTYTSYWKIIGDSNHNDKASASIDTTIAKKAISASVSITGWSYGNTANSPSVSGNDGNGTVTYNYKLSSAADSTYSATVPSNAGSYTIRAVIAATSNYLGATVTTTFTIAKVDVTYTAPTAKTGLVYNGSAQDVLNAGTVTGGTIKYSKDETNWSTSIPQYTSAGLYTSYWRIDGDSNHNNYSGGMLSTRISKATGSATISAVTATYSGSAQNMISVSGNTGTMHYRVGTNGTWLDTKPTRTVVGSDTIYYYMDASTNYNGQGSESEPWGNVTSTINKANRTGFAVSMANWVYGTTASDPSVSNNFENGAVTYSYKVNGAADSTYSPTKPSDIGTYVIKAVAAATSNYNESTATKTFSITKLAPTYTAPTAKTLTYTGSALSLLNAGSTNDGTIQYSSDNSTWSTTIPSETNASTYTVYWRLIGDTQHENVASKSITVTISKKSISPTVSMSGWTYGGTASSPSVSGNDGNGAVTYKYKTSGAADSTYSTTKPSNTGTYVVWASIAETANYQSGSATTTFTISKANISPSVSMSNWTYGGTTSNPSVSGNSGSGGVTYEYKTKDAADSTYSSTKPSTAGTYTVKASIAATANYNGGSCTTNFTINKANPSYSAPTAKTGLTYSGSELTLYNAGSNTTEGSFSITNGKRTNAGTQSVSWTFTPTDTTNYNSKSGSFDVTIAKANISPSVSISGWVYGNTASSPSVSGNSGSGNVTYYYKVSGAADSTYTTTIPFNAGTYTIKAEIATTTNYNGSSCTNSFTISKADLSYTAPTATNPTYNGSAQALLNAGSVTGGTILYSSDNSTWSSIIPTETNAALYILYWKIVGDSNHKDKASDTIASLLYPATGTLTASADTTNVYPEETITITYSTDPSTSVNIRTSGEVSGMIVSSIYDVGTWKFVPSTSGTLTVVFSASKANYVYTNVTITITVNDPYAGHAHVNLGLPSNTMWAKTNIGAASETDAGNYYKYGGGSTTYDNSSSYTGIEDPLATNADTAAQVWGGKWHMPTIQLFNELLQFTTKTETTINGVEGIVFANTNDSSLYIFLPSKGYYYDGTLLNTYGLYWSSKPNTSDNTKAYALNMSTGIIDQEVPRYLGLYVRGVVG